MVTKEFTVLVSNAFYQILLYVQQAKGVKFPLIQLTVDIP